MLPSCNRTRKWVCEVDEAGIEERAVRSDDQHRCLCWRHLLAFHADEKTGWVARKATNYTKRVVKQAPVKQVFGIKSFFARLELKLIIILWTLKNLLKIWQQIK